MSSDKRASKLLFKENVEYRFQINTSIFKDVCTYMNRTFPLKKNPSIYAACGTTWNLCNRYAIHCHQMFHLSNMQSLKEKIKTLASKHTQVTDRVKTHPGYRPQNERICLFLLHWQMPYQVTINL